MLKTEGRTLKRSLSARSRVMDWIARKGSVLLLGFAASLMSSAASPPAGSPIGLITGWSLSQAIKISNFDIEKYPDKQTLDAMSWNPVACEVSGLVNISRFRSAYPSGTTRVWARSTLHADQAERRPMTFGYSDAISVYLNGQILFHGSKGIIGWNDTVFLPLEKGDNELMLMVSNAIGGWGFQCRDANAVYLHPDLVRLWELPDLLRAPESVAYDAKRKVLYVTNFNAGFVSKIALDGRVLELKWVEGLSNPTGIRIHDDRLYVVERQGVAEVDLNSNRITQRYPIVGAGFLNDLSLDAQGRIYVTDSSLKLIYRIEGGRSGIWLKNDLIDNANGILVEKDRLLIGITGDGTLKSVDLRTQQVSTFLTLGPGANMDGLVTDGKGGYLFSDFFGRIFRIDARGEMTLLLDRMGPKQFCADFEYIPEQGLLVVPSLFDYRLTAYRFMPQGE